MNFIDERLEDKVKIEKRKGTSPTEAGDSTWSLISQWRHRSFGQRANPWLFGNNSLRRASPWKPSRLLHQRGSRWLGWRIVGGSSYRLLFREEEHSRYDGPQLDGPGYRSDVPIARCGHPGCARAAAAAVLHWRVVDLTHRAGREAIRAAASPAPAELIPRFIFRGGNGVSARIGLDTARLVSPKNHSHRSHRPWTIPFGDRDIRCARVNRPESSSRIDAPRLTMLMQSM